MSKFYAKAEINASAEIDNLIRTTATETQTHKSRFARFENMQEVFAIKYPERLTGKHVLLVDDIVTTGSTPEAWGVTFKSAGFKVEYCYDCRCRVIHDFGDLKDVGLIMPFC